MVQWCCNTCIPVYWQPTCTHTTSSVLCIHLEPISCIHTTQLPKPSHVAAPRRVPCSAKRCRCAPLRQKGSWSSDVRLSVGNPSLPDHEFEQTHQWSRQWTTFVKHYSWPWRLNICMLQVRIFCHAARIIIDHDQIICAVHDLAQHKPREESGVADTDSGNLHRSRVVIFSVIWLSYRRNRDSQQGSRTPIATDISLSIPALGHDMPQRGQIRVHSESCRFRRWSVLLLRILRHLDS